MAMIDVMTVLPDVAQICKRAPDGTLIGAYIRAVRKWCHESRWYRANVPGSVDPSSQLYSLGSDPVLEIIDVPAAAVNCPKAGGAPNWLPIFPSDSTKWPMTATPGRPQLFQYVPEGQIAVWPIPDQAYEVRVTVALQPKSGQTQIDDVLLRKWDQAFQAGALGFLHDMKGEPWYDAQAADRGRKALQSAINNARADVARGFTTGSRRATPRQFIV